MNFSGPSAAARGRAARLVNVQLRLYITYEGLSQDNDFYNINFVHDIDFSNFQQKKNIFFRIISGLGEGRPISGPSAAARTG